MKSDYTTVVGVDRRHLSQLRLTWLTWRKHKPSLLERPMLVFFDTQQVRPEEVYEVVDHPQLRVVGWPADLNTSYTPEGSDPKFDNPQRYKMLAGFVHVPSLFVTTHYWLKLDTDVVATGMDNWFDNEWLRSDPAIIAHAWSFTKPPDQMQKLDAWVASYNEQPGHPVRNVLGRSSPLGLIPKEGASRLGHKRIISWCGLFGTAFTRVCSHLALTHGKGEYTLPVPSQDGYLWYCAARMRRSIVRVQMKARGWEQWSTDANVRQAVERAMQ